jgi:hypothetical protein
MTTKVVGDYRVILIGAVNPGLTGASYRTETEAREAAAVLCLQADRVLIKAPRGRVLWDSNG